tara:strand:+ start:33975 stop:35147 length:1173 start_codon:yes stop_codon:yes gene_type:complete
MREHCVSCDSCAKGWQEIANLTASLGAAGSEKLSPARSEELRTAVLAMQPKPKAVPGTKEHSKRLPFFAIAAIAATVLIGLRFWPESSSLVPLETIVLVSPHSGAQFTASDPMTKNLRLENGTLTVNVPMLAPTRTFEVITNDGVLQTENAQFDVVATNNRLVSLTVLRGKVAVQGTGGTQVFVSEGNSWVREFEPSPVVAVGAIEPDTLPEQAEKTQPVSEDSTGERVRLPATRSMTRQNHATPIHQNYSDVKTSPAAPIASEAPSQSAFTKGWHAMKQEQFHQAAELFSEAILNATSENAKQDASYWRAAALGRSRERFKAIEAFRWFVSHYPKSPRVGEASAILGWLLIEDNRFDEAEVHFFRGSQDMSERVRASAEAGLDAVKNKD